jgi:CHAT domain-containing protein
MRQDDVSQVEGSPIHRLEDPTVLARLRELGYLTADDGSTDDARAAFAVFLTINGFPPADGPDPRQLMFLLSDEACPCPKPAPLIGKEEVERQWVHVQAVLEADTPEARQAAMVEGLLRFGLRYYRIWQQLVSMLDGDDRQPRFREAADECLVLMIRWLKGNTLTGRPDEDERRALAAMAMLEEGPEFWQISHYCVQSLLTLQKGHALRNERFARNVLRAQLRRYRLETSESSRLFELAAIGELLRNHFHVPDDASVWIQRGEQLLPIVDDLDEIREFYSSCMQFHIDVAHAAKEKGDAATLDPVRAAAERCFERMQAAETDDDSRARNLLNLSALYVLTDQQDLVCDCYRRVLELGTVNPKTMGLAACYEARGRLARGEHARIIEILQPRLGYFCAAYLGAVREEDVVSAGETFAEVTVTLAFAFAAVGRWADAIAVLEAGKSQRLRFRAALRKHPETTRLLEIESQIYALQRGIPDQGRTPTTAQIEDWFAKDVSPLARLQQEYVECLPVLASELSGGHTIAEIAASLDPDEALVSLALWWTGTMVAVIVRTDRDAPRHTFLWPERTQQELVETLTGEIGRDEGFLYALERGIRYADPRPSLDRLIAFADNRLGKPISEALRDSGIRRLVISPHNFLRFVPFWALPSLADFEVRLVPASAYAVESARHPRRATRCALAVANPTLDLAVAPAEAASVRCHLASIGVTTQTLSEDDATEDRISEILRMSGVLHFAGHGKNSLTEPTRCSLLVSPDWPQIPINDSGEFLTLFGSAQQWIRQDDETRAAGIEGTGYLLETENPDNGELERTLEYSPRGTLWALHSPERALLQIAELWMAGDLLLQQVFDRCGLAFLSACGSGVGAIQGIEEGSGLPAALLAGGVPSVISAFWPVEDALTALFVDIFYEMLAADPGGGRLTTAVRSASLAIRDISREQACNRVAAIRDRANDSAAEFQLDVFIERLRQGPERPFVHPFDWGAFYLTGAARLDWVPLTGESA